VNIVVTFGDCINSSCSEWALCIPRRLDLYGKPTEQSSIVMVRDIQDGFSKLLLIGLGNAFCTPSLAFCNLNASQLSSLFAVCHCV
jgi:hypothetical protein